MKRWAALGALIGGLAAPADAAPARTSLTYANSCQVEGAPAGSRCGTLHVPEDRSRAGSRRLALRLVVVPGEDPAPADPIVYIAGGPGESAVDALPLVLPTLRSVEPRRPIIFLDQRGTGGPGALHCPGLDLVAALSDARALRACAAALQTRAGLDLYSSTQAVADLEDLRAALGHRQVNLVGVSYGVRVALLYMREHPLRVRAAILRAAYPLDYNIIADGTVAADAQLAQLISDCERDRACAGAYPKLRSQLAEVDDRLKHRPLNVPAHDDGGPLEQAAVTRELFQYLLLVMMQSSVSRQYVPLLIATAAEEGLQAFAAQVAQLRAGLSRFPVGMYFSVICAEDAPRRPQAAAAPSTLLGASGEQLVRACGAWPVRPQAAQLLAPFSSRVPTLIISGALDPVTPPGAAMRLASSMPMATHYIVPATAHGPMFPDCLRPKVAEFLRAAAAPPLGTACDATVLPPFALRVAAAVGPEAHDGREAPASNVLTGTWDLEWRTSRGTSPGGYLVISQKGARLEAQLHGRGSIRATGSIEGNRFTLRGSRLFVPYTLTGTLDGDSMEGTLKVLSVERSFTGRRRPAGSATSKHR